MNSATLSAISTPPPVFVCTYSKQVMEDPVINLCGHLFDQKVLGLTSHCPLDYSLLNQETCIPLNNDLGKAITNWKAYQAGQTLLDSREDNSSPDLDQIQRKLSVIDLTEIKSPEPILPTKTIKNVHQDDIHGIISSRDGYITGSKDTTVKMWNAQGELTTVIQAWQSNGYKSWVTALHRFSNDYWAYGTRDGNIIILNQKGDEICNMANTPPQQVQNTYKCKDRNKVRINCITEHFSDKNTTQFYVGTPKFVQLWDGRTAKQLTNYCVDQNDWVYCIEPIPNDRLAVVYGSTLQLWQMSSNIRAGKPLRRHNMIVARPAPHYSGQREHISSIAKLHNATLLACAVFDGSLRVVDLSTQQTSLKFNEHQGRVWSVVRIEDDLIVSSADDRTIKVWDLRTPNSIRTIVGGAGRVSSLLVLNEHTLLSGSCPDNVFQSQEKADIAFWDLRTFTAKGT